MKHERGLAALAAELGVRVEDLVAALLPTLPGWRDDCEIIPEYVPPHARDGSVRCVVRYGTLFLRYSKGPKQGFSWDFYGDDMQTPALALAAILRAPEPFCLHREAPPS